MIFNKHSALEGQHAFLGASKYHWINYDESKVAESYSKFLATQKGTELHDFAAKCITLGQKLPKSQKTLNMYVNDAIGFKMVPKRFGLPMEGYTYYFTYEETLPHKKRSYWQMPCSLGIDLSQGDDFCAFTFLFPLSNGSFGVKTRNYISSSTLMKLPAAMRIKYDQFMDEGSLIVLEGTVLDMMEVYEDLDNHIAEFGYDVRCLGYDPYNAKEFIERWSSENGPFGIEKVIQGAKTESVPLGELKKLSEERMLLFDEELMTFAMGNCIVMEDTNGNRKLLKKRYDAKIDAVAAMMDAFVAFKLNRDAFE